MDFDVLTVQDLVNFCKEHNLSLDTVIMLNEGDTDRPFITVGVNKGTDGKCEPIIELA